MTIGSHDTNLSCHSYALSTYHEAYESDPDKEDCQFHLPSRPDP